MPRSRRSAAHRYHDRVAGHYDHSYDDAFWQWHDALTWDYLKPFLPRDLSAEVIDLGCGTGKWAAKLLESGFTVTCLDISHRMLDQARGKIEIQPHKARARFVQADLSDLSGLPADRYSLALVLGDAIGFVESPRRALVQIRRILKHDGVLVATLDNRLAALDYYLEGGDSSALARFLRDGKTHWLTERPEERFPIATFGPSEAVKLVESAGFRILEVVGKTVLPMRKHRQLLATSEAQRRWARIEKKLCRNPDAIGRAAHLQIACSAAGG